MYSRILINFILILILFILQFAFISGLPSWFGNINLIIVILIFLIGMGKSDAAFWWVIGMGFLMEIFSFLPFGIIFLSLVAVYLLAYALLMNYFTDRTLYTFLAITLITTIAYNIVLYLLNALISFFTGNEMSGIFSSLIWMQKLAGMIMNLFLVFIAYYLINYLSRNLKPVFLIRKK